MKVLNTQLSFYIVFIQSIFIILQYVLFFVDMKNEKTVKMYW